MATAVVATPALVVLGWGLVVLPLILLRVGLATAMSAYRVLGRTSFRAGVASGLLLVGSCNAVATWASDDQTDDDMAPIVYATVNYLHEQRVAAFDGFAGGTVDEGRRWLKVLAVRGAGPRVSEPFATAGAPLGLWGLRAELDPANVDRCFDELGVVAANRSERRNVDIAVAWLIRNRSYSTDDAEDLVQATLLRVCEKAGAGEVSGSLGPYFMNAVKGNDRTHRRNVRKRATCALAPTDLGMIQDRLFRVSALDGTGMDLDRIHCSLSANEQTLFDRLVEGWTSKEIAEELDDSDTAVRQRIKRLRDHIFASLNEQHRRPSRG